MIYYFSATGNSRWVAQQLAHLLEERAQPIAHYTGTLPQPDSTLTLVFPIHCWRAPEPVVQFVERLAQDTLPKHLFVICTCGDDAGKALKLLARHTGLSPEGMWSVQMPNTYVPMFALDSPELCQQKIAAARPRIAEIAHAIRTLSQHCDSPVYDVTEGTAAWAKSHLVPPLFYRWCVTARGFHTLPTCTSCATCQRACPTGSLTLAQGHPQWADTCIHCMACYHSCPHHAIHFRHATQGKGQYRMMKE